MLVIILLRFKSMILPMRNMTESIPCPAQKSERPERLEWVLSTSIRAESGCSPDGVAYFASRHHGFIEYIYVGRRYSLLVTDHRQTDRLSRQSQSVSRSVTATCLYPVVLNNGTTILESRERPLWPDHDIAELEAGDETLAHAQHQRVVRGRIRG